MTDIAQMMSMIQNANQGGGRQSWFDKPFNPGAQTVTSTVCGIATGNVSSPFGALLQGKPSGASRQMQWEQQILSTKSNEAYQEGLAKINAAHQALVQACAAAGPMPAQIQQAPITGGRFDNGLGRMSFASMVSGGIDI